MSNPYVRLLKNTEHNFSIFVSALPAYNCVTDDVAVDTNVARQCGLHWITKGKLLQLTYDGDFVSLDVAGQVFAHGTLEQVQKRHYVTIAQEDSVYYCIRDNDHPAQAFYTGEVAWINNGVSHTFTDTANKRLFTTGAVTINDTQFSKHSCIDVGSVDSVTITSNEDGASVALFWQG